MNNKLITNNILNKLYPNSTSCSCNVCREFCRRPGWWTVEEARLAIKYGLYNRMMLEMSYDLTFGVLSPAFKGAEANFSLQEYANNRCTFLKNDLCELHNTPYQPLECRFCHHSRIGLGKKCHRDLENDWNSIEGQILVEIWCNLVGLVDKYKYINKIKLKK